MLPGRRARDVLRCGLRPAGPPVCLARLAHRRRRLARPHHLLLSARRGGLGDARALRRRAASVRRQLLHRPAHQAEPRMRRGDRARRYRRAALARGHRRVSGWHEEEGEAAGPARAQAISAEAQASRAAPAQGTHAQESTISVSKIETACPTIHTPSTAPSFISSSTSTRPARWTWWPCAPLNLTRPSVATLSNL